MATQVIRVPERTHARLKRLAAERGRPIGEIIDGLLDDLDRRTFFAGLAEDFRRLRDDQVASADYDAEVRLWESTLGDGLDGEPVPPMGSGVEQGAPPPGGFLDRLARSRRRSRTRWATLRALRGQRPLHTIPSALAVVVPPEVASPRPMSGGGRRVAAGD
jgi:predicted DNA-binding protein